MSTSTAIQWTWSPWLGCRKVSPGCENCYITTTTPFRTRHIKHGAQREELSETYWKQPLYWNNRLTCDCGAVKVHIEHPCPPACPKCKSAYRMARVFPSLCDPFDPEVPQSWFNDFFRLILATGNLTWIILTKRPEQINERMVEFERLTDLRWDGMPDNVWLGVSIEDQKRANERIPILLSIPAKVRVLSVEPMLERIDLDAALCGYEVAPEHAANCNGTCANCPVPVPHQIPIVDWVIFGGESGPNARRCQVDWIRDGLAQCRAAGVNPFVKQLGSNAHRHGGEDESETHLSLEHSKGGDPSEWPEDLRVRELPTV